MEHLEVAQQEDTYIYNDGIKAGIGIDIDAVNMK